MFQYTMKQDRMHHTVEAISGDHQRAAMTVLLECLRPATLHIAASTVMHMLPPAFEYSYSTLGSQRAHTHILAHLSGARYVLYVVVLCTDAELTSLDESSFQSESRSDICVCVCPHGVRMRHQCLHIIRLSPGVIYNVCLCVCVHLYHV